MKGNMACQPMLLQVLVAGDSHIFYFSVEHHATERLHVG